MLERVTTDPPESSIKMTKIQKAQTWSGYQLIARKEYNLNFEDFSKVYPEKKFTLKFNIAYDATGLEFRKSK